LGQWTGSDTVCPNCGSEKVIPQVGKTIKANVTAYPAYRCDNCGTHMRGTAKVATAIKTRAARCPARRGSSPGSPCCSPYSSSPQQSSPHEETKHDHTHRHAQGMVERGRGRRYREGGHGNQLVRWRDDGLCRCRARTPPKPPHSHP